MPKHVLMIAFHYPPCSGSSGLQRTLAFTRYLPRHGWQPLLVTAQARAYERSGADLLSHVPPDMPIHRAFALDTARHLAIAGRYPASLALPDRWRSWAPFAIRAARRFVRKYRPALIWSTYPIATAHVVAARVHRETGIPWIADMRDPLVETDAETGITYPRDPALCDARLRIEREAVNQSAQVVFCSPGAREICRSRYDAAFESKYRIIENGYDESLFEDVERTPLTQERSGFTLLHSGTVYPGTDRGPDALFAAVRKLRAAAALPADFRIVFRASGHDSQITKLAQDAGVQELIELKPAIAYREALKEMFDVDGLLLLQGRTSNPAIPAKVYEYLRCGRPILALAHPQGDTADLLRRLNIGVQAPLDDAAAIEQALRAFVTDSRRGAVQSLPIEQARRFSRAEQTALLAEVFDSTARSAAVQNAAPATAQANADLL